VRVKRYSWGVRGFPSVELALMATSPYDRVDLSVRGKAEHVAALKTLLSLSRNLDGHHIQTQATPQEIQSFLDSNPILKGYKTHRHLVPPPDRDLLAGVVS
jgi:hypothetical protein